MQYNAIAESTDDLGGRSCQTQIFAIIHLIDAVPKCRKQNSANTKMVPSYCFKEVWICMNTVFDQLKLTHQIILTIQGIWGEAHLGDRARQ